MPQQSSHLFVSIEGDFVSLVISSSGKRIHLKIKHNPIGNLLCRSATSVKDRSPDSAMYVSCAFQFVYNINLSLDSVIIMYDMLLIFQHQQLILRQIQQKPLIMNSTSGQDPIVQERSLRMEIEPGSISGSRPRSQVPW